MVWLVSQRNAITVEEKAIDHQIVDHFQGFEGQILQFLILISK